jgi:hypothetical protein
MEAKTEAGLVFFFFWEEDQGKTGAEPDKRAGLR